MPVDELFGSNLARTVELPQRRADAVARSPGAAFWWRSNHNGISFSTDQASIDPERH